MSVLGDLELDLEEEEDDRIVQHSEDVTDELLDNLGYVSIFGQQDQQLSAQRVLQGISGFRLELRQTVITNAPIPGIDPFLNDEEIDFLQDLSSLDDDFHLHKFSLEQIKSDPILTRVLNFRLMVLSLHGHHQQANFKTATENALNLLKRWLGSPDTTEVIEKTGQLESLITALNNLDAFDGSLYDGIVFFRNPSNTALEKSFENDKNTFQTSLGVLSKRARQKTLPILIAALDDHFPKKNRVKVEQLERDPLNRLFIRLIQLRLWLFGTYDGRLDEDMGAMSLQAIEDLTSMVNFGEDKPIIHTREFIMQLDKEHWAINARFLLSMGVQKIEKAAENDETVSIAGNVEELANQVEDDEKDAFYEELETIINAELKAPEGRKKKKKKSRGGKGFFRQIGRFFKKIGIAIGKGLKAIVKAIKQFFNWIKNGVRILINEIKKGIQTFKEAISFVFGKREVRTGNLYSNYDFDFDVVTLQQGLVTPEMIAEHKKRNQETLESLKKTITFLEEVLPLVLSLLVPPIGWVKLGLKLVGLATGKLT